MDPTACTYDSTANTDDGSCFYDLDALPNPIEITYIEENLTGTVGSDLIAHIHIRNASCDIMNDLVVRRINTNEAEPYFCFNGICFPTETHTSPNPLSLNAFEEDDYFKGYLNADVSGVFEVTYRFYIEDNPSEFTEVVIAYEVN